MLSRAFRRNENKVQHTEGDDQFWFSNAAHVACLFDNKVMFLLNIMLIYFCAISLKRGHWVFAWRRAQPGSRPVRCPKMQGACRLGRYS